jgi:hypothetical protein
MKCGTVVGGMVTGYCTNHVSAGLFPLLLGLPDLKGDLIMELFHREVPVIACCECNVKRVHYANMLRACRVLTVFVVSVVLSDWSWCVSPFIAEVRRVIRAILKGHKRQ